MRTALNSDATLSKHARYIEDDIRIGIPPTQILIEYLPYVISTESLMPTKILIVNTNAV